jgi:hypothetical protein
MATDDFHTKLGCGNFRMFNRPVKAAAQRCRKLPNIGFDEAAAGLIGSEKGRTRPCATRPQPPKQSRKPAG